MPVSKDTPPPTTVFRGWRLIRVALFVALVAIGVAGAPRPATVARLQAPDGDGTRAVSAWLLQGVANITVDAFVDGRVVATDLVYGDVASFPTWTPSVGRHLEIRNSADGATLLTAPLEALTDGDYSLVLVPPSSGVGGPRLTLFDNDIPDLPSESMGWLSIRNVDLLGTVDLRMDGIIVATDIERSSGVLVGARGWVDVSVVLDGVDVPFGAVQVLPGRATIGHLIQSEPKSGIWQTLLITSTQDALGESCDGHRVSVDLAAGNTPTEGSDVILGTEGDDLIFAGAGDDIICAGAGNDTVRGQRGNDIIFGGPGDDLLSGSDGNDHIDGGTGSDNINGGRDDDVVLGGPGADIALRGGTGDDLIDGGAGADLRINGNGGQDLVTGGAGDDAFVAGGPRRDQIFGGLGDDVVRGFAGADRIFGGAGSDQLFGGGQSDSIYGGTGTGIDICTGGLGLRDVVECSRTLDTPEVLVEPPGAELTPRACDPEDPLAAVAALTCWELRVPADYAEAADQTTMSLAVRRATRGGGAVPLLILDGDLEALSTPFNGGLGGLIADPDQAIDLIMVDLRGTGESVPNLDCPEVDNIKIPAKSVTYTSSQSSIVQAEAACAERLRRAGIDFSQFNAAASSRDLELLRQGLSLQRWNIWAGGPGTLVAQDLVRDNPDAIGRVVLQSAMDFGDDFLGQRIATSEEVLAAIEEACAADAACSASHPTLGADRVELYRDLSKQPQEAQVTVDDASYIVAMDGDRFLRETLMTVVQGEAGPAAIPELIDVYSEELPAIVQAAESQSSFGTVRSEGALLASLCQDQYLVANTNKARCAPWLSPGQVWADPTTLSWPVPTLILGGAFDPITPAEWGSRLAASSPLAVEVTFADAGTGMVSGQCAQQLIQAHFAGQPLDSTCRVGGSVFGS